MYVYLEGRREGGEWTGGCGWMMCMGNVDGYLDADDQMCMDDRKRDIQIIKITYKSYITDV